jgi:FlaA1/EpsC-like NDP-sugar epimerase
MSVTPAQLLNRPDTIVHGEAARLKIRGSKVLVTGAGGSIGSEIVRQVYALGAEQVYLVDHDENALHAVQLELHGHGLLESDTTILADIREAAVMDRVMRTVRPDIVFHAAAHKHLPLLERFPAEGVRTNVLGTRNVVAAALGAGVSALVNISTDKAARPTSVLGVTKRLAEMVVAAHAGAGMAVASVRFGNVLGSHGSFLRSMAYQVARDLPVTITDPAVSRYFMTIPEAASLVVEASTMAVAGETYVLDMGEPVRILDLAQRYLRAMGRPDSQYVLTGLRPGEKMREELYDAFELRQPTLHPRIWCVRAQDPLGSSAAIRRALALAHVDADAAAEDVREDLFALLPTPAPAGAGMPAVSVQTVGAKLVPA